LLDKDWPGPVPYTLLIEPGGKVLYRKSGAADVGIGIIAARTITNPLQILTDSSRAIAQGDFSQRVRLKSRTEFGELAATFNTMSEELEQFVYDLKRAANENRDLFLASIQMLAGAVDEKDPYTRGHSDRVTRYSMMIAKEMGLNENELEVVRISAQLHDVGKIGIEDRILKKPGALTEEEFDATTIGLSRRKYNEDKMYDALLGNIQQTVQAMLASIIEDNAINTICFILLGFVQN